MLSKIIPKLLKPGVFDTGEDEGKKADPEEQPEEQEGAPESDEDDHEKTAAAADGCLVAGFPAVDEGEVAGVGFEPEGKEVANDGQGTDGIVDKDVESHAKQHGDRQAAAHAFGEQDESDARGKKIANAGKEADDGVQPDAEVGAGNADEAVHPLGDDARGFGGDGIDGAVGRGFAVGGQDGVGKFQNRECGKVWASDKERRVVLRNLGLT